MTQHTGRQLQVERMGLVPYGPMLALQEQRQQQIAAGERSDTLFLLQHHAVVTTGRNTGAGHVLASQARLAHLNVDYFETGRGGDVTYHGPGQIVGYPIVALQPGEQDIKAYVFKLEEVLIRTAADFGVVATRVDGLRGIWVGNNKLAAIGVRLARWVTLHGFALNVSVDLDAFGLIVPCGLVGRGVTSLGQELGAAPAAQEVEDRLVDHCAAVLQRTCVPAVPTQLPQAAAPQGAARVGASFEKRKQHV